MEIINIVIVAILLFYIICWWKVFEKAGQKGWLTLIPGVNFIYFLKISEKSHNWYFALLLLYFGHLINFHLNIIDTYDLHSYNTSSGIISFVGFLFLFYVARSFTRKFNDNSFWAPIGFIFFNFLYIPLLAFDNKASYKSTNQNINNKPLVNNSLSNKEIAAKEIFKWHLIIYSLVTLLLLFIKFDLNEDTLALYSVLILVCGSAILLIGYWFSDVKDEVFEDLSNIQLVNPDQNIISEELHKDENKLIHDKENNLLNEKPSKEEELIKNVTSKFSKKTAIATLEEKKKLLELEIITQEEYNSWKDKLKQYII